MLILDLDLDGRLDLEFFEVLFSVEGCRDEKLLLELAL